MITIAKPNISVREVLIDCLSNMTNEVLKNEILASIEILVDAETEFDQKKLSHTLNSILRDSFISDTITVEVLKKLYSERVIVKGNLAREHYNYLLSSAPRGRCPLCNQRKATTLDHYLPKSRYALLAITPVNLVPSCKDCNIGKKVAFPNLPEEETIHPYYDDITGDIWLRMVVVNVNPFLVEYFVDHPLGWSDLLVARLRTHFDSFDLQDLYSDHAVEEFENIKLRLEETFSLGGTNSLTEHLNDSLRSVQNVNINSWRTAFYTGLLNSADFCNGLFV